MSTTIVRETTETEVRIVAFKMGYRMALDNRPLTDDECDVFEGMPFYAMASWTAGHRSGIDDRGRVLTSMPRASE